MFVTWVIYLLAVQCLAVTEEGNTARLDKKVFIEATIASEVSDVTSQKEQFSSEEQVIYHDYVPVETKEHDFFLSKPQGDDSSNHTDTTSYQEPKSVEFFKFPMIDYVPLKTVKTVLVTEAPEKLDSLIPDVSDVKNEPTETTYNNRGFTDTTSNQGIIDGLPFFSDIPMIFPSPSAGSAMENNENSTDFPDSALDKPGNNAGHVGTERNSKTHSNKTKPEDLGLNERTLMAQNTINFLLSLCCIALSFKMIYFRVRANSTKSIVHILFLQNGIADFFVGIGVLSQSPVLYLMILKSRHISGITVPVFISFFVTAVAVKMSVFLNCVLGVVRCINIVNPFYRPNKKILAASTLLYMKIWMLIVGLDLWQFADKRGFKNEVFLVKAFLLKGQPGSGLIVLTMNKEKKAMSFLAHHLGNLIQFIIPTALPTLLCFVLMIVQLYHMPKKSLSNTTTATKESKNKDDTMSKARMTIFLLTCIYVITSGVSIVTWLVVHGRRGYLGSKKEFESSMKEGRTATSSSDLTAIYFSLSTCPLICSTLTPLTLLLRGTGPVLSMMRSVFNKSNNRRESSTTKETLTSAV